MMFQKLSLLLAFLSLFFLQCDMQQNPTTDYYETSPTTFVSSTKTQSDYMTDVITVISDIGNEVVNETEVATDFWQWQPIAWTWWSILQLTSALLGFLGNFLVILVIFKRKERHSTDTLIGSLAVADFLTSIFLVPIPGVVNVPPTWVGELYCKVIYTARFMWTSVSASVFTLTLLSVERFIAVAYPFRFRDIFSSRNTVFYIILVWIMAIVMNSFAFFIFFVDADSFSCTIIFPTENGGQVLGIISFFLVLVNPVVVMLVTQALTAYKLHLEAKRFKGESFLKNESQPAYRLLRAKKRVIRLLFVVNITFIICWAPDQSAYLAFNLGLLSPSYLYGPIDRTLVVLAFCNSCANPIIYTIQHPQFRSAIRGLFTRGSDRKAPVFMVKD